jgi:hypothetical protein
VKENPHTKLVNDIAVESSGLHFCRLFKMNVGMAEIKGREIRYGTPGIPDLVGFVKNKSGHALFVGVEVKTGDAVLSKEQKNFHTMLKNFDVPVLVARNLEQALAWLRAVSQT